MLAKYIYFFFACVTALLICINSTQYFPPQFSKGFLSDKVDVFYFYKYALYIHIFSAPLAFFTSIFQLLKPASSFHKLIGRIYVYSVCLFAAPSGFIMSFFAIGGFYATLSFALMSIFWVFFTIKSIAHIRNKNIVKHTELITRSIILAHSAIVLRWFSFINHQFEIFNGEYGYIILSWLSWLPILFYYEIWLRIRKRL